MRADYTPATGGAPVACTLASAERGERQGFLDRRLSENVAEVRELPDGYALRCAAEPPVVAGLLEVIFAERECCPFFTFELVFEPDRGPLWLRLRGPEGTKEVIRAMLDR